jgi:hypothetical protein
MFMRVPNSRNQAGICTVFSVGACLAVAASDANGAAIPINYSVTKNYTFTTNANVVPTLNEQRYGHAYDYLVGGGGTAVNTAQNSNSYDGFAADGYNKNFPDPSNANVYTWAIFNYPKGLVPVAVKKEVVNGLTVAGSPYKDPTNAGNASANVDATVTALAAKNATGTLTVSGSIPAPAKGEQLFAMSYGQLTAQANGVNLAGRVTNAGGMVINNLSAPRGIGSTRVKTGAADPVDLFEYDNSGNLLSSSLLFESQGEVDGYGLLDWENNSLNVTADNATFFLTANPFSSGDPSGTLQLTITDDVVSFLTTGTAFQSCQTTQSSGPGSFSCALPTSESFNYSYDSGGNPITVAADFEQLGFTQAGDTPEPSSSLMVGFGLIVGVRLWRRCVFERRGLRRAED